MTIKGNKQKNFLKLFFCLFFFFALSVFLGGGVNSCIVRYTFSSYSCLLHSSVDVQGKQEVYMRRERIVNKSEGVCGERFRIRNRRKKLYKQRGALNATRLNSEITT